MKKYVVTAAVFSSLFFSAAGWAKSKPSKEELTKGASWFLRSNSDAFTLGEVKVIKDKEKKLMSEPRYSADVEVQAVAKKDCVIHVRVNGKVDDSMAPACDPQLAKFKDLPQKTIKAGEVFTIKGTLNCFDAGGWNCDQSNSKNH